MEIIKDIITFDELFGEVSKMLKKYKPTGEVTEENVMAFMMDKLRLFGNNVTMDYEVVVPISDYVGKLPDNLLRINRIEKCRSCKVYTPPKPCEKCGESIVDPESYPDCKEEFRPCASIQKMYKWVETNKYDEEYNICDNCEREINTIVGCEVEYVPRVPHFWHMHGRERLSFGFGAERGMCTSECMKHCDRNSPYDITITSRQIRANFPDGKLFFNYYGLPLDSEGKPAIANSPKGYVYEHLKYYVLYKLLELIMFDDESAASMYAIMKNNALETERKAVVDAKAGTFSIRAYFNLIKQNRMYAENFFNKAPHHHHILVRRPIGIATRSCR